MTKPPSTNEIYLEVGDKKVFACSVAWPGWCRSGKDAETAVQALYDTASRYRRIVQAAGLEFDLPVSAASFHVSERVEGNATTDFGAPAVPISRDNKPVDDDELGRMEALLQAYWQAFDEAVDLAEGKELRKGPRGGGRDVPRMIDHVVGAEEGYLNALGWKKIPPVKDETMEQKQERIRGEILEGLRVSVAGQIAAEGPRGGKRWPPRYFVRRVGWHVLDHAWEMEDRVV